MSRNIQNDHPFSDDEIQYLRDRGREREVALNAEMFPPGSNVEVTEDDSPVLELSQKVYEFVSSCTVDKLKSELKKYGIKPTGSETDLRIKLAQHLQELEDNADA